ncbi:MAG: glycoside hydrolase family 57 protein [Tepidisphaeraceae bacterium]
MPLVCLYFQVHQPYRLRRYSVFDTDPFYFDDLKNAEICRKVAHKCYLPANRLMKRLIDRHGGKFKLAYSISGVALEQFEQYVPEVIETFKALADTGHVEFLSETYHHTLASLYSESEFRDQIGLHAGKIKKLFGQTSKVFRNTELIYNNEIGLLASHMGYDACLTEGADHVLGTRTPNHLYQPPHAPKIKLLLKNYRLSDDIAFRFSNRAWPNWPLTARKFADWVRQVNDGATGTSGSCCNLFMDYETFGEHQWADTGIFEFLEQMPEEILADGSEFVTPSELSVRLESSGELDIPHAISWADTERDLSAWLGNAMQSNALHELYKLEKPLKAHGDDALIADWRRLQSSDHFYYMCTKYFSDGDVHKYFSPYESPYDSYINFMNVLDNINARFRQQ